MYTKLQYDCYRSLYFRVNLSMFPVDCFRRIIKVSCTGCGRRYVYSALVVVILVPLERSRSVHSRQPLTALGNFEPRSNDRFKRSG